MNSNNLDIEQIKKAWRDMGKALGMDTSTSNPDNMNNRETDLDRLHTRYMRGRDFSILGGIIFSILIYFMPPLKDEYRISVVITYAILLLANAYVLNWFCRGIGKINPLTMTISEVASMAKYYKKCHLRYHLLGLLASVPWIVYFFYALIRSGFRSMEGLVMGLIIGSICGLRGLWKYLDDYHNLSE